MAVLGLPARTNEKHHQYPCDFESNLVTVILFYERQRQVHSSRNTCRRINRPITQIDPIGLNYDRRILPGKLVAIAPMGAPPFAVKQSSGCEHERSGADTRHSTRSRCQLSYAL